MKGPGKDTLAWLVCSGDSWVGPSHRPVGWGRAMETGAEYLLLVCTWPCSLSPLYLSRDVLHIGEAWAPFAGKKLQARSIDGLQKLVFSLPSIYSQHLRTRRWDLASMPAQAKVSEVKATPRESSFWSSLYWMF